MTSSPTPESRRRRYDDRDERDKYDDRKRRKHRSRSRSRSPKDSRKERDRSSRKDERSDRYDREKRRDERRREDSEDLRDSDRRRSSPKKEEDSAKALQEKLQSKQMMEEAQAKIQQKLKAMGKMDVPVLPEPLGLKSLRPEEASAYIEEASAYIGLTMSKTEQRLADLKNKLKSSSVLSSLNLPGLIPEKKLESEVIKEAEIEEKKLPKVEQEEETLIDPRLQVKRPERGRRAAFKFVQPGEYQKQANIQRNIARLHKLQAEIGTVAKQTGISSAVKLSLVTPDIDQGSSRYFPTIEWWDEYLLQNRVSQ
uniref:U4/U6 small nuclear ribonucleoprotein Prp3 n=1 Tax=Panagrolaimus sp. JU765 TaxID=591449 RepID=A0AC34QDC4_9BILA